MRDDRLLAVVAVVLLATANAAQANLYAVRDLGILSDPPGDTRAVVSGLNSSGKVVASRVAGGACAAMIYGGAWTNLGTLGGSDSFGAGVNDALRVVGSSPSSADLRAFLWTPGGTDGVPGNPQMKDLGTLGGITSEASAINSSGQVTGYAETSRRDYHAFRYSGGAMSDIGELLGNQMPNSYGYGINDAGHIAGEAYDNRGYQAAFYYNGTTAVNLGTLPGGDYASALALNNADHVVGYSSTAAKWEHAFLYAGGVLSDLGTLDGNYSYAKAINNSNVVVGVAGIDPGNPALNHAFIWAGGEMVDLNTLLDASGNGWTLVEATDINDAGQIVGIGTYGDESHGFLLSPVPQITQQPANLTVACHTNASFTVAAAPAPLSCQWYRGNPPGGSAIVGASGFTLVLSNVTGLQEGGYYAVVANALASATSSVATLTVADFSPPVLNGCPGNQTNYLAPGASNAVVTWSNPTATDDCDGVVPVFTTPPSGSTFNLGVTAVTCRATDSNGNTNTCAFSVALFQAVPPTITAVQVQGTNVLLSFTTQDTAQYAVDDRAILTSGGWEPVMTGLTGTGGIVTITNPVLAAAPALFYRVRLTLPAGK